MEKTLFYPENLKEIRIFLPQIIPLNGSSKKAVLTDSFSDLFSRLGVFLPSSDGFHGGFKDWANKDDTQEST